MCMNMVINLLLNEKLSEEAHVVMMLKDRRLREKGSDFGGGREGVRGRG